MASCRYPLQSAAHFAALFLFFCIFHNKYHPPTENAILSGEGVKDVIMSSTTTHITAADLWNMPADNMRHELVRGELRTMAPAGSEHGAIIINLAVPLGHYVKTKRLGVVLGAETGFTIDTDTVRAPDIAFVVAARIPSGGVPKEFWPGPPDLAVEVVSPCDRVFEIDEKIEDWLTAGVQQVWVVNPRKKNVAIHARGKDVTILTTKDHLDAGDVVPGFRLAVMEIFQS